MEKYAIAMISILESDLIAPAFESVDANPLYFPARLIKKETLFICLLQILVSLIETSLV